MTTPRPRGSTDAGLRPEVIDGGITDRLGLATGPRTVAAALSWEAFGQKPAPALGPRGRGTAVLERAPRSERAVVALAAGDVVGLAGFHLGGSSCAEIRPRHLVAEFGWAGVPRWAPLAPLARRPRDGELLLHGIVVRSDWRGKGIGTALPQAVVGLARSHGLATVRPNVVETNPGARRLDEREGFMATTTERSPHLGRPFGFSVGTTMVKEVGRGPAVSDWAECHPSAAADTRLRAGADGRPSAGATVPNLRLGGSE